MKKPSNDEFWALWEIQRTKLMRYCLRLIGNSEEEAKDALGGTLLKALDAWNLHVKKPDNPVGWLFRIAHNQCMDLHREVRNRVHSDADPDELSARNRDLHPDLPESPEETFLRREMHINLEDALAKLPSRLRKVMVLRCIQEYSYPEIAEELQLTPANVRKRIQEGRDWMRKFLDGYLREGTGAIPEDIRSAGDGEKRLVESLEINPYQDLLPDRNQGTVVGFSNRKDELLESFVWSHHSLGRLDQKITAAEKYIQRFPTGWKKRMDLAEYYYMAGQWEPALEQVQAVLDKNPRLLTAVLLRTRIFLQKEDKKRAVEELKDAVHQLTLPGIRPFLDGAIALMNHQYGSAIRAFKKSLETIPGQPLFRDSLIRAWLAQGDPKKVLTEGLYPEDGSHLHLLRLKSVAARDLEAHALSHQFLDQILEQAPDDLFALERQIAHRLELGKIMGEAGKTTRKLTRKYGKLAPESALFPVFQAEYHFLRGNQAQAESLLSAYLKAHPRSLRGTYHLARFYYLIGKNRQAKRLLNQPESFRTDPYIPVVFLHHLLEPQKSLLLPSVESHADWEKRSLLAWKAMRDPDATSLLIELGASLLESRSGWPASWYRKGWCELVAGRIPEARHAWQQAWDLMMAADGHAIRAGIALGMMYSFADQPESKQYTSWRTRLTGWLPLLAETAPYLLPAVSPADQLPAIAEKITQNPGLFFLKKVPELWLHPLPLF